jgi:hypothetical protein
LKFNLRARNFAYGRESKAQSNVSCIATEFM